VAHPSPALIVDLAAADRNIERAAATFRDGPVRLRPHFKAHKCTTLMRRQLDGGGCCGVTCATAWEARVLAEAGFDDVLVANEVADPAGLAHLTAAAALARVTVCVDDARHVELLAASGARLGLLVEIDVGQRRCGLRPDGEELLPLARMIAETSGLELRGLQGYHGHAVLLESRTEREQEAARTAEILAAERDFLLAAGLPCDVLSGGGTGTWDLPGVLTEVQAGSYVLMDASYGRLDLAFEQALFCRTTVVSRRGTRIVLDAGLKALSAEYGMPRGTEPGLEVLSLADEHATALVPEGCALQPGDTTLLIPAHVDPTVNLHPALYVDGEAWAVDGRTR
jgi:D-serine deaminase-like pyridoxal phosphate-dependent protein